MNGLPPNKPHQHFYVTKQPELTDNEYQIIANFVHKESGINLLDGKKELVRARLAKRINQLNFADFKSYFKYIMADQSGDELVFLLDSLATNLTSFYREPQHFDFMTRVMLPELEIARRKPAGGGPRLRIWSCACSSGEEPYTIAIEVLEKNPYFGKGGDFRILATDLSTKVLNIAKRGEYGPESAKNVPHQLLHNYFTRIPHERGGDHYKIVDNIRRLISFRRFNLMDPLPIHRGMDLVFCRNVMIYFDRDTITNLVSRFYEILEPGGYLFIGHSESLSGLKHNYKYVAPCIYRKLGTKD
ncbi:MAG: protein-glutamate O-methyltransferase [Deltaproteobacteria bacterium]|jgi:chemotaxis protein methyltransferase CheR|nr:protein-glutamate O-methyltransferase [Deltaproteobacteria bacterium]